MPCDIVKYILGNKTILYRIEVDETSLREFAAKLKGMGNTAKR